MQKLLLYCTCLCMLLSGSAQAQIADWDTLDLHSPQTNIFAALQFNDRLLTTHAFGVSYSDDYGANWLDAAGAPRQAHSIWTRDGKMYASRVQNGYDSTWVSDDGGLHFNFWGEIRSDNPSTKVIRGDTMFAIIVGSGLYRERVFRKLRGAADPEILFECPPFHYTLQLVEVGTRLILLSTDGIRWTNDNGLNWEKCTAALPLGNAYRLLLHQNTIFLFNNEKTMFRSQDAGETWDEIAFFQTQEGFLLQMVTEGNDLIATTHVNPFPGPEKLLWRSTDFGETWIPAYPQLSGVETNLIGVITPAGKRFFTNKGCYAIHSNDSIWETRNYGLPQDVIREAVRMGRQQWVIGTEYYNNLYLTRNYGHTYQLVWQRNGYAIFNAKNFGETLLVQGGGPGFLRSDDAGENWYNDPGNPGDGVKLYCKENEENLLVSSITGDLYRYHISTAAWEFLSHTGEISALAYLSGFLYVNGDHGIRVSGDLGQSFELKQNGLPSYFEGAKLFALNQRVFSTDSGAGLYVTRDTGETWSYLFDNADGGPFAPFENIEGDGDTLYAYARFLNKIFYSFNGGEDWLTSAIPAHQGYFGEITCLKKTVDSVYAFVHQSGRHIVIARKNEGGMMHPGPAAANHIRIKFAPNPGDPLNGTTVEFTDGSVNNESVDTKIYDLSGHLMLQTTIQANDNKATLPKMPKGIYDVQVRLGKKTGAGIMLCN